MTAVPCGGPLAPTTTLPSVTCKACGYWNQLVYLAGDFWCRDVARCTRLARAPEFGQAEVVREDGGRVVSDRFLAGCLVFAVVAGFAALVVLAGGF